MEYLACVATAKISYSQNFLTQTVFKVKKKKRTKNEMKKKKASEKDEFFNYKKNIFFLIVKHIILEAQKNNALTHSIHMLKKNIFFLMYLGTM